MDELIQVVQGLNAVVALLKEKMNQYSEKLTALVSREASGIVENQRLSDWKSQLDVKESELARRIMLYKSSEAVQNALTTAEEAKVRLENDKRIFSKYVIEQKGILDQMEKAYHDGLREVLKEKKALAEEKVNFKQSIFDEISKKMGV